jgi:hypothetical protein
MFMVDVETEDCLLLFLHGGILVRSSKRLILQARIHNDAHKYLRINQIPLFHADKSLSIQRDVRRGLPSK